MDPRSVPGSVLYDLNYTNSTISNLTNTTIANTTITNSTLRDLLVTSVTTGGLSNTLPSVNYYAPDLTCWTGSHYVHVIFSITVSIAFILICVIVQLTYFETKTSTHNQSAKSNSKSDVFMLFCKFASAILFAFLESDSSEWILIIILFFLSAFMFISYYEERPYYNDKMMKVFLVVTGIYFWNTLVLLIGKILENTNFNGNLSLFFLGVPIIIVIILTNYDNKLSVLLTNINKFQKGEKVQTQIRYFLELIDKKDLDRNSKVLLKGYIYLVEEACTLPDCALKKYIYNLENNMDTLAFLLQHAESLYQNGISKFPNCTPLRISYSFFLLERMNKKQQANIELQNTEKYGPRFEEQFIIYRYKKLIEEQSNDVGENEENMDVVSNIAYKNHSNQFKACISKVSTLYLDFWSLLLNPNQDNQEDLSKLNDYGSKINIIVEEIHQHFEKMQKIKNNDQEIIRLYSDFLNDILNDKEKANNFKSRLNEIEGSKQNYDEVNLLNVDINALASSDEYQYIIISAQPEKFGIITNISLGVCTLFGYTRGELIGKNIEHIMPEIYHKSHRNLLTERINEYKKLTMNVQNSKNYKPTFKDVSSYGKNKSRYLVPINFKVSLLPNTENNDSVFIAKISQDLYNIGSNQNQQTCFILTNNSFIIQNFTANSLNILGMNSNTINNQTMEITKFIKEFNQEFLKYDFEEKTLEQILSVKKQIISSKFKSVTNITWRKGDVANIGVDGKAKINSDSNYIIDKMESSSNFNTPDDPRVSNKLNTKIIKNTQEQSLYLTIKEVSLFGKQEGYIFRFETYLDESKFDQNSSSDLTKEMNSISVHKELVVKNINNMINSTPNFFSTNYNKSNEAATPMNEEIQNLKIDKSFLPESESIWQLDPKKMSYIANPRNPEEIKNIIKEEALRRLHKIPTDIEVEESSVYTSEYSNSVDQSDIVSSESSNSVSVSERVPKKKQNDEYYRINFNNFKFLIYDYKKDALVEVVDWEKESHVEYKKNEDFKKKDQSEVKTDSSKTAKEKQEVVEEEVNDNQGKEGIIIKQIEYALSKEETQPTITRMKWISFFIFLVFIGIAAVFLALFLNSVTDITENINLVYDIFTLVANTIYGVFHTRELILLNNPKYVNIYQQREEYIKNNTDEIINIFTNSHLTLTDLITTFLPLSTVNDVIINNGTIFTTILEDDLTTKSFELTLSSAFIETNTALYHVGHQDITELYPANKDVFFYLYNAINDISVTLLVHSSLYIEELQINSSNFQNTFLSIFISATCFGLASYFMISYAFSAVCKRKESYLEVFFEIGGSTIKNSLEKCEKFSKKIQADNLSDAVSNLDEAEMIQDTTVQVINETKKLKSSHSKKRRNNNSRETKVIKFKMMSAIFFICLFFFLVYYFYKDYLDTVNVYIEIYQNISEQQRQYLLLFNMLREYFFDSNTFVSEKLVKTEMEFAIDDIYKFKLDKEKVYKYYF